MEPTGAQAGCCRPSSKLTCWLVSLLELMSHITEQTESKGESRRWTLDLRHVQDVTGLRCYWRWAVNLIELRLHCWKTGSERGLWQQPAALQRHSLTTDLHLEWHHLLCILLWQNKRRYRSRRKISTKPSDWTEMWKLTYCLTLAPMKSYSFVFYLHNILCRCLPVLCYSFNDNSNTCI